MDDANSRARVHPAESSRGSRAGPTPTVNQLAEYMWLVTPCLATYSGEVDTMTFEEWEGLMMCWFDSHQIPEEFRVPIAAQQLRGPALSCWDNRRRQLDNDVSWFAFADVFLERFHRSGHITRWNHRSARFYQQEGESIRDYGERFEVQMVSMHPFGPMSNLHQMVVYSRGLQPYFRIPRPRIPFRTIEEMRLAHERRDDREFLPFGLAPRAPVDPVVPPAPARNVIIISDDDSESEVGSRLSNSVDPEQGLDSDDTEYDPYRDE